MKWTAFVLLLSAFVSSASAEVTRYTGKVELTTESTALHAAFTIEYVAKEAAEHASFLLNEGFAIKSVECDQCRGYSFQAAAERFRYAPRSRALNISFKRPVKEGEHITIHVRYGGKLVDDPWGTNRISPDWTEISLYSAWYPLDTSAKTFTYSLDIVTDRKLNLSGNGLLTGASGHWRMTRSEPTNDIVVLASPQFQTRVVAISGSRIRIDHMGLGPAFVDRIAADVQRQVDLFSRTFGDAKSRQLTVALNRRERGGGYARPGFVCLPVSPGDAEAEKYRQLVKSLAHEVAHLWWSGAPTTTWEDWLNESFAEYSALMYVRHAQGEQEFRKYLDAYLADSKNTPAIWGVDRNSDASYVVLYHKGALRLNELESGIGRERFADVLRTSKSKAVSSTEAFLDVLRQRTSPEVAEQFRENLTY